jgi:tRNA(fMet)-specific endonuclease VapC
VKYLLDTNVLSDFARGDQAVMARLRQEAPPQLAVSVITEMEVEYGLARNPNLAPRVREAMRMLLNTISALPFEREDARVAAQLRASLNSQGTPIGAYDLRLVPCGEASRSSHTMRGSSSASAGSDLRTGTARKLRNATIRLGLSLGLLD